jgi:hypothetical protein
MQLKLYIIAIRKKFNNFIIHTDNLMMEEIIFIVQFKYFLWNLYS